MNVRSRGSLLYLLSFILLSVGCLEQDEGCLDPNAVNLDVTADKNAGCNYPELRFNFSHRWGPEGNSPLFRLNEPIVLSSGDTLRIRNFDFYISNAQIGEVAGLTVFDTVETNDRSFIMDDLTIVSPGTVRFVIGHVRDFGTYEGLEFQLGFEDVWNHVDTAVLKDTEPNHPWLQDKLRRGQIARRQMRVEYEIWSNVNDSISADLFLNLTPQMTIVTQDTFETLQANHIDINLFLDYSLIFENVDWRSADSEIVFDKILTRMDDAIHVIQ